MTELKKTSSITFQHQREEKMFCSIATVRCKRLSVKNLRKQSQVLTDLAAVERCTS